MDNEKLQENLIIEEIKKLLIEEGIIINLENDLEQLIIDHIIPSLDELKEVQSPLYESLGVNNSSIKQKAKASVVNKVANIVRNTVEKSFIKQQKFNDNISIIIAYLLSENKKLKEEINKLKNSNN